MKFFLEAIATALLVTLPAYGSEALTYATFTGARGYLQDGGDIISGSAPLNSVSGFSTAQTLGTNIFGTNSGTARAQASLSMTFDPLLRLTAGVSASAPLGPTTSSDVTDVVLEAAVSDTLTVLQGPRTGSFRWLYRIDGNSSTSGAHADAPIALVVFDTSIESAHIASQKDFGPGYQQVTSSFTIPMSSDGTAVYTALLRGQVDCRVQYLEGPCSATLDTEAPLIFTGSGSLMPRVELFQTP